MKLTSRRPRAVLAALAASATVTAVLTTPYAVAEPVADHAVTQAAAPDPTVDETFDGTTLPTGWNVVDGTWKVQNGRLVGTSTTASQLSRITSVRR
jgi:glycerophosphoryl diester phosphodiesterase